MELSPFVVVALFLVLMSIAKMYKRNHEEYLKTEFDIYKHIRAEDLAKSKQPILWIHIPYELNSRKWINFGSRNTSHLNKPYLELTLQSIVSKCENSFKICFIDDSSFAKLLPNWKVDMSKLTSPLLERYRVLAMAHLLHEYGGLKVPISFLCMRDLIYDFDLYSDNLLVADNICHTISNGTLTTYAPDVEFMGAKKNSPILNEFIEFMQRNVSEDYTSETEFTNKISEWFVHKKVNCIQPEKVGVKTADGRPILIDDLFSEETLKLYDNIDGIWIPSDEILKRNKYNWFAVSSVRDVLQGNYFISKALLVYAAGKNIQTQPQTGLNGKPLEPDWVGYWKTPLLQSGLWGMRPLNLGDDRMQKANKN